ncbi:MAG: nucleotidyltransferase family protein [bacterium]|nr:nucleotidyltransferase family protein [bacterium]
MKEVNINTIIPLLESSDVEFAGVFGSYAKGKANQKSDIDILVKFKQPKSLIKIIGLERKISEILSKEIDLVTENSLSPYIRDEILNSLKVIYGRR